MIEENLLLQFNATIKEVKKGEIIFEENTEPLYYFQIIKGAVKLSNFNDEGKEFTQGIFCKGECFGEPPLFIERKYPANAIAMENTQLYYLPKEKFMNLLHQNPLVSIDFIKSLSKRMYFKTIMVSEISSENTEHKLLRLMDYWKQFFNSEIDENGSKITLTRQQMANLTGLRVETVIRTIKLLEQKNEIKIVNRKIYR